MQTEITSTPESSPARTALVSIAALVFPGLGHFVQGKWVRGALLAFSIVTMFLLGIMMKGNLFTPVYEDKLTWVFSALNVGLGLPYFICMATGYAFTGDTAAQTFEYGKTFLAIAGACNFLAAMDAFDIAIGRKK